MAFGVLFTCTIICAVNVPPLALMGAGFHVTSVPAPEPALAPVAPFVAATNVVFTGTRSVMVVTALTTPVFVTRMV